MGSENVNKPARHLALHWQSQAVLLVFVPVAGTWLTLTAGQVWAGSGATVLEAIGISVAFAALVFAMRAATLGAALTGGVFTAALYMETPGWRTALWPLLTLFVLTYAATRFGRRRKELLGTAEGKRGRTASQVAANLGVAVLAGMPPVLERLGVFAAPQRMLTAMLAAMAEATADTVSSELGQVLGGEPRMITTLRRVPPGTDGGISWVGTLAGSLAAAIVVAVGGLVLAMTRAEALIALGAAVAGLFFDSLLGAVVERRGWLNNDAVNALSTLAAAVLAGLAAGRLS